MITATADIKDKFVFMRPQLKHIKWMPVLMTLTVLAITGFQLYWLKEAYNREERTLAIRTNMAFRETINSLQTAKLKLDGVPDPMISIGRGRGELVRSELRGDEKIVRMVNVLRDRVKDSGVRDHVVLFEGTGDTARRPGAVKSRKHIMQFLYDMESLQDSIKIKEIDSAYSKRLDQQGIDIPFVISRLPKVTDREERVYNEVTIGFKNPATYKLQISDTFGYTIQRIGTPILLSVFLVAFTIISFALLYRNLLRQQRLGDIKNEFISNITHELKTPIATVSVAIEALRSFSAGMDAQKTKSILIFLLMSCNAFPCWLIKY
jgi:two-component system phosphate regulon sensor histidine kinase PhoR